MGGPNAGGSGSVAGHFEVAAGMSEHGTVVGNAYDKYGSSNPIVRRLMRGFEDGLASLLAMADDGDVHEVGCGEGRWSIELARAGRDVRATDFSEAVIDLARGNARRVGVDPARFVARDVYELTHREDAADVVVCCEVLEHLDDPLAGLRALARVTRHHLICSVPREPLWRTMNLARGRYVRQLGNTPGHVQHWSRRRFEAFVSQEFDVVRTLSPLPWTMLLCAPRDP